MSKKRKASILVQDGARGRATTKPRPPRAAPTPAAPPAPATPSPAVVGSQSKRQRAALPDRTTGPSPFRPSSPVAAVAAAALDRLLAAAQGHCRGASLKTLTLGAATRLPRPQDRRAAYALATRALAAGGAVATALASAGAWPPPPRLTRGATLVLGYDLAFGSKHLSSVGSAERLMLPLRPALAAAQRPPPPPPPHTRAVRVNTLAWSREDALAALAEFGATADPILSDVVLLPPSVDVHDSPHVQRGALVLQSRASALPAAALAPESGWRVVDACAAPGNKTTQVAAMVGPTGRVTAYERDPARLPMLQASVARAVGAGAIINAQLGDFLAVDPASPPASEAHAVLLDPSCSGSGTAAAAVDAALEAVLAVGGGEGGRDDADTRVARLAAFQLAALRHALSFPVARRVVYSTCSVHVAENEAVVAAALEGGGNAPPARAAGWRLATALPAWPTRGERGGPLCDADADAVIRAEAGDGTDGFFVAMFERER